MSPVDRFVEEMGRMFQEQGDPRIAGRILGLLLVEGRELSLQQLSERLAVSRASASTNARLLAKRGAIHRTAHSGDRQDFYQLNTSPYFDMVGEMAERVRGQASVLASFIEPIRAGNGPASDRIADLSNAFGHAANLLSDWAMAMREDPTMKKDEK